MATVVIGAQWGDEGKGKLVDILCDTADLCARAQGGNNAGHTIVANGVTYDFHLLPSGLVNPKCINLIGSGVVCHIPSFFKELEDLVKKGLDTTGRILISDRCHVVFDLHQLVDGLEEVELGAKGLGTTRKGIGPCYSTKAARSGVRVGELVAENQETWEKKLRTMATAYEKRYGDLLSYDVEAEVAKFKVRLNHSCTPGRYGESRKLIWKLENPHTSLKVRKLRSGCHSRSSQSPGSQV
jgi:adenylosuccinate synthase